MEATNGNRGFSLLDWGNFEERFLKASSLQKEGVATAVVLLGPPCFEFSALRDNSDDRLIFLTYFRALITFFVAIQDGKESFRIVEETQRSIPSTMEAGPESEATFCVSSALSALISDWDAENSGWMFWYGWGAPGSWSEVSKYQVYVAADEDENDQYIEEIHGIFRRYCSDTLDGKTSIENFYGSESWSRVTILPHGLREFDSFVVDFPNFRFWRDWYKSMLEGRPLDLKIQRQVAEISSLDWEMGEARISEKIQEITARVNLERRIEDLEQQFTQVSRLGIGGNNPPEPIEQDVDFQRLDKIWPSLQKLKAEISEERPDRSVVIKAVSVLISGLKAAMSLIGRLGEHALTTAITSIVSAGTATIIAKPELLETVIEAAKAWLPFL